MKSDLRVIRWTILVLAFMLVSRSASAECAAQALDVWPRPGSVPVNTVFVVEGYGLDQSVVENVGPCELMLVSESERLCLIPDRRYVGEFGISQVTLHPERLLTSGTTYALSVNEKSPRVDGWLGDPRRSGALDSLQWTADLPEDELSPKWLGNPKLIKAEVKEYGCGPAIGAEIRVPAQDESPTLVFVTILEPEATAPRSYLLQLTDDLVFVGHGMCSGAFDLAPGAEYQASIDIVDVAGNEAKSPPKEVRFRIPDRRKQ
jgi:hypothetical protein